MHEQDVSTELNYQSIRDSLVVGGARILVLPVSFYPLYWTAFCMVTVTVNQERHIWSKCQNNNKEMLMDFFNIFHFWGQYPCLGCMLSLTGDV